MLSNIKKDYQSNNLNDLASDLESVSDSPAIAGGADVDLPNGHLSEITNEIGCIKDLISDGSADSADLSDLNDLLTMKKSGSRYIVQEVKHGDSKYRPANRDDYLRAIRTIA